jgi:hypothetical protein
MPKNNQQLIASYQEAVGVDVAALSTQDTGIRLRQIPGGTQGSPVGTQVFLPPDDPGDGDTYEIIDADGSCNGLAPMIVTAPTGTLIANVVNTIELVFPEINARFTYEAEFKNWTFDLSGIVSIASGVVEAGTVSGQAFPGNYTPGQSPGTLLWVASVTPSVAGQFKFEMTLTVEASVADSLSIQIATVGGLESVSGGQSDPEGGITWETSTSPVTFTATGTPTTATTNVQQVPAGEQVTITVTGVVTVPLAYPGTATSGELARCGILCTLFTAAAGTALSDLALEVTISESV